MKAISIHQPYARCLVTSANGRPAKQFETRGYAPPPGVIGQRVAICSTAKFDGALAKVWRRIEKATINEWWHNAGRPNLPRLNATTIAKQRSLLDGMGFLGAVLGVGTLEWSALMGAADNGRIGVPGRCHVTDQEMALGDWKTGRYAWRFVDVDMLTAPVPVKGQQRVWALSPFDERRVKTQLRLQTAARAM